jgi:poly-gamma-glutamate synthesis protein (capsule biosynthesis protein)
MTIKKVLPWIVLIGALLASLFLLQRSFEGFFSPFGEGPGAHTPSPFLPVSPTETIVPTLAPTVPPSPTPSLPSLWLHPDFPGGYRSRVKMPSDLVWASSAEQATYRIAVGSENPISQWVYALVAPFPTLIDGVSSQAVRDAWSGQLNPAFNRSPLLMTESTLHVFTKLWGEPAAGAIRVVDSDQLTQLAWESRPSWALVPFEALAPRWKVLLVDGTSPIRKDFTEEDYPLTVPFSFLGGQIGEDVLPVTNRDPEKMTTLVMTGVTALVRATAYTMEAEGLTYPAKDIRPWLVDADITHISNEIPFAENCPFPDPNQKSLKFCSDPRYIKLLEYVGTDIVELTGDHFGDWGPEAMLYTLELYDQRGWPYYGGGENRQQARKPVILEHHGHRFGFIGCNAKGGGYAQAAADYPGAVACDFEYMADQVRALKNEGVIPIVTFQHFEYYTYKAQPVQVQDAARMTKAGAVIVSGSQAHQPQAIEIEDGAIVHHGLGNLFFDQYTGSPNVSETRKAFVDRHVFYDGKHISTELLTMVFVDYARARPMTVEERRALLQRTFSASGW